MVGGRIIRSAACAERCLEQQLQVFMHRAGQPRRGADVNGLACT